MLSLTFRICYTYTSLSYQVLINRNEKKKNKQRELDCSDTTYMVTTHFLLVNIMLKFYDYRFTIHYVGNCIKSSLP